MVLSRQIELVGNRFAAAAELVDAALPVVLASALVASAEVRTAEALVVVLVVQTVVALVVVLPVVVVLADNFVVALAVGCRCTLCLLVWHFPSAT